MWVIEIYRLNPSTGEFSKIEVFDTYQRPNFYQKFNYPGAASFVLDIHDTKATRDILQRFSNIVAFKYNNTIIWAGFISHISGSYSGVSGSITVECIEYFSKLFDIYTDNNVNFSNTDQSAILESLVTTAQAKPYSNLGITVPTYSATVNRDATYNYMSVGDAIINNTNLANGLDFVLRPTQDSNNNLDGFNLNFYEAFGVEQATLNRVQLGLSASSLSFATQADVKNNVTAISNSEGEDKFTVTVTSPSSQASYGNRELIEKYYDILIKQTLESKAQGVVDNLEGDKFDIEVTLMPNQYPVLSFLPGDSLELNLNIGGYVNYTGYKQVSEIAYSIDEQGQYFMDVKFSFDGLHLS